MGRPAKRMELLSDAAASDVDLPKTNKAKLTASNGMASSFHINEEYAKRFEHNKKREEKHRLEEKHGSSKLNDEDEGSSTSQSEDDDAELATADLDREIFDTLHAIKAKDPRVYDTNVTFYSEFDPEVDGAGEKAKEDKPMYLRDYHRRNLLEGAAVVQDDDEEVEPVQTYDQEQEALRRDVVGKMHAYADAGGSAGDAAGGSDDDGFLVRKKKQRHTSRPAAGKANGNAQPDRKIEVDVKAADKDPDTFLSNFMAARAWLPTDKSHFQAFDSDDSDEEARADEFEAAYNMRFEDPATANARLMSFGRDVGKYSVRRDDVKGRKRAREREREKRAEVKSERDEERARLRRLKIDEMEEKVRRIKNAAGLRGRAVDVEDWGKVLEEDWDDARWEAEMKKRFGESYYAEDDNGVDSDAAAQSGGKKRKAKKPKWEDDIDIKDLVPGFEDEEKSRATFSLSDGEDVEGGAPLPEDLDMDLDDDDDDDTALRKKTKTKKDRLRDKSDAKRAARKQRQKIEELVDSTLPLSHPSIATASSSKAPAVGFRYRQTSPSSFGLTPRDILFADDAQLNTFAGLKKMAAFRDPAKKARDKKKLSKKARLRLWRKETFGAGDGPQAEQMESRLDLAGGNVGGGGSRKKKRRRNGKGQAVGGA